MAGSVTHFENEPAFDIAICRSLAAHQETVAGLDSADEVSAKSFGQTFLSLIN
jgi:hypothetical protein